MQDLGNPLTLRVFQLEPDARWSVGVTSLRLSTCGGRRAFDRIWTRRRRMGLPSSEIVESVIHLDFTGMIGLRRLWTITDYCASLYVRGGVRWLLN